MLLLAVFTARSDVPTPKPGEATVAAAEAPAAVPRSTASNSGGSAAADAHPAGAGSELVRAVDMVQWLGQVEIQFGLVREEMQAAWAKTDASIAGNTTRCQSPRRSPPTSWTPCFSRSWPTRPPKRTLPATKAKRGSGCCRSSSSWIGARSISRNIYDCLSGVRWNIHVMCILCLYYVCIVVVYDVYVWWCVSGVHTLCWFYFYLVFASVCFIIRVGRRRRVDAAS